MTQNIAVLGYFAAEAWNLEQLGLIPQSLPEYATVKPDYLLTQCNDPDVALPIIYFVLYITTYILCNV